MAVYPDRIVLKNSTDNLADIEQSIGSGGTDEILTGEIVLGLGTGTARLFTRDAVGTVVQFGGSDAVLLGGLNDVNLTGLEDGDIIRYDDATQTWLPTNLTFAQVEGVTFGNVTTLTGSYDWYNVDDKSFFVKSALFAGDGFSATMHNTVTNEYFLLNGGSAVLHSDNGLTVESDDGASSIRLADGDGLKTIGFYSPDELDETVNYILPASDGPTGYVLTTDGSANLSWSAGPAPDLSAALLGQLGDGQ